VVACLVADSTPICRTCPTFSERQDLRLTTPREWPVCEWSVMLNGGGWWMREELYDEYAFMAASPLQGGCSFFW